jgi:putative inorganic carbon (HCO3(-)) transporter
MSILSTDLFPATHQHRSTWATLAWAAVILLALAAVLIASEAPLGPVVLLSGFIAVTFAYRYPYFTYGLMVALVPFLGINVGIPTGKLAIGERAFGGSVDMSVGEVIAIALLAAWAIKIVALWIRRRHTEWKPWLPLALPMAAVVGAHMLSAMSAFSPDTLLVIKFALRPVAWCYLIYVLLTVNFVRSKRRLMMVLGILMMTGMAAALMGFISLGIPDNASYLLPRARPLPMFGIAPLGDNHNLLAEWLVVTIPATIALLLLAKKPQSKRLLGLAAAFQTGILLLTFARTAWIVFTVEAALMAFYVWRQQASKWIRPALVIAVLLLPLAGAMFAFNSTAFIGTSTETRAMLTGIALSLWSSSPWIGMGAGSFVDRVGNTWMFVVEHGAPLDSHGFIQKLLVETGLVGLAAVAWLVWSAWRYVRDIRHQLSRRAAERHAFSVLAVGACGALVYQLFNTSYWNGKMWLALGIMLAAGRALSIPRDANEDPEPVE